MKRPQSGLSFPVSYERCRDGDTIVCKIQGCGISIAIRLLNCWAPEKNTPEGRSALSAAQATLLAADPANLSVWIPFTGKNPFTHLSFDRILAHLFISDEQTLGEYLIDKGLASSTKDGQLGE